MNLSEPTNDRRDLAGSLTVSLGWIFVTVVGLLLKADPHGHGTHQSLGLPPCPSVLIFDRPCPGCGLTTSWTALLHGNFDLAFHAHPLGPIIYAGYTAFALSTFVLMARKRRWREQRWSYPALIGVFSVFVAFGIVRMAISPHYAMAKEQLIRAAQAAR